MQSKGLCTVELSEVKLCSQEVYALFAHYLVRVYVQETGENKGDPLKVSTTLGYMGYIINMAASMFKANGRAESKLFFTCLDSSPNTEAAIWLLPSSRRSAVRAPERPHGKVGVRCARDQACQTGALTFLQFHGSTY